MVLVFCARVRNLRLRIFIIKLRVEKYQQTDSHETRGSVPSEDLIHDPTRCPDQSTSSVPR